MAETTVVDVAELSIWLERRARPRLERTSLLQGVSLSVCAGEYVEVRGHSGSGKTTLLQLLAGIRPAAGKSTVQMQGRAVVAGVDVLSSTDRQLTSMRRDSVIYIPQFSPVMGALSVRQNMELPYWAAGQTPRSYLLPGALDAVALTVDPSQSASVLSGGEQRRLSIAAALISPIRPQLLVIDEPTAGLGVHERSVVLNLLQRISTEEGTAVVSATHEDQMAARALVLSAGQPTHENDQANLVTGHS